MAEATPLNVGTPGFPTSDALLGFASVTVVPESGAAAIRIPPAAHTFVGFRQWMLSDDAPPRGRFSYIDGELIADMSPESYETHNSIKTEITSVVYQLSRQLKLGRVLSDGFLVSHPTAGLSTEPDATFASFASLRAGRCQIVKSTRPGVSEELVGSPDWVLEIVSRTSRHKDTQVLREAYFQAGIAEYWLVDVLGEGIQFEILIAGPDGFTTAASNNGWAQSPVFGRSFRLTREMDQDDLWQYTLEVEGSA